MEVINELLGNGTHTLYKSPFAVEVIDELLGKGDLLLHRLRRMIESRLELSLDHQRQASRHLRQRWQKRTLRILAALRTSRVAKLWP